MRRDHVIFCLLLGVLINIAVALIGALTLEPMGTSASFRSGATFIDGWGWNVYRWEQWGVSGLTRTPVFAGRGSIGAAPIDVPIWSGARRKPARDAEQTDEIAAGWPLRSLRADRAVSLGFNATPPQVAEWRWGHALRRGTGIHVIPGRPLPVGFLANSVLYAAASYALLVVFLPKQRGDRRAKRGRCPGCGYDLREQLEAGCPECGWGRPDGASSRDANAAADR